MHSDRLSYFNYNILCTVNLEAQTHYILVVLVLNL